MQIKKADLREKVEDAFQFKLWVGHDAEVDFVTDQFETLIDRNQDQEISILFNLAMIIDKMSKPDERPSLTTLKTYAIGVFSNAGNWKIAAADEKEPEIRIERKPSVSEDEAMRIKKELAAYRLEHRTAEPGEVLARMAERMPTEFPGIRWTPSGPDPEKGYTIRVERYDDKSSRMVTNNFALWVHALARKDPEADLYEPGAAKEAHMNCWEGVMYAAYKAGLIDTGWILKVHLEAEAARVGYTGVLIRALGFEARKPLSGMAKLLPERGDIVFIDQDEHIAISLGGIDVVQLWSDPSTADVSSMKYRFNKSTLVDFRAIDPEHHEPLRTVEFAPCPFTKKV